MIRSIVYFAIRNYQVFGVICNRRTLGLICSIMRVAVSNNQAMEPSPSRWVCCGVCYMQVADGLEATASCWICVCLHGAPILLQVWLCLHLLCGNANTLILGRCEKTMICCYLRNSNSLSRSQLRFASGLSFWNSFLRGCSNTLCLLVGPPFLRLMPCYSWICRSAVILHGTWTHIQAQKGQGQSRQSTG